jgi:hypothetical protein
MADTPVDNTTDSEQAETKIPQPEWRWSKGKVEIFDSLFPSTTNIEL